MDVSDPRVRFDESLGFRRLDPPPSAVDLERYYEASYAQQGGENAPDVRRLRANDAAAQAERRWRSATIYADVVHYAADLGVSSGRAVDVGCGTGEFVRYLTDAGVWDAVGVERDRTSIAVAESFGVDVVAADVAGLAHGAQFDLVTMFNVLEHVPDPDGLLATTYERVRPGGVLVVQVPNDFSELQLATRSHLGESAWWIAVPDHVNYFDFATLSMVVERAGFRVATRFGTFPMEFFLLSGLDYLNDAGAGSEAHRRRCEFELALDAEIRRSLNEAFARGGLGRNAVVIAQRP